MERIYDVRVWRHGRHWLTAREIKARTCKEAIFAAIAALRKRPALRANEDLRKLNLHLYGHGPAPDGVKVKAVEVDQAPGDGPVVVC